MINKFSKLYNQDDYTISTNIQAHDKPLYAFREQVKVIKQKHTPLGIVLKGVIKERMFGNFNSQQNITNDLNNNTISFNMDDNRQELLKSKKLANSIRKNRYANSQQLMNFDTNRSKNTKSIEINRPSFLSSVEIQKSHSKEKKKSEIQSERKFAKVILPSILIKTVINSQIKIISPQKWNILAKNNKLKREQFQNLLKSNFSKKFSDYFIRYFDPPFQQGHQKYQQFVNRIDSDLPRKKLLFLFQFFDNDKDGILSFDDLFNSYNNLQQCTKKVEIEKQIYRISEILKNKSYVKSKNQSLEQFLSKNHQISLNQIINIIEDQHKPLLESTIKKLTGYRNSYHVTEHNEQTRQHKQKLQEIKAQFEKGMRELQLKQGYCYQNYILRQNELFQEVIRILI